MSEEKILAEIEADPSKAVDHAPLLIAAYRMALADRVVQAAEAKRPCDTDEVDAAIDTLDAARSEVAAELAKIR